MKDASFCHLHIHTCYSILDSTLKINKLVDKAQKMGMSHLAITDHAVLFGAIEFYNAASNAGIRPIMGCDLYIAKNGINTKNSPRDNKSLVLLAENEEGYRNLVKLVSKAHLEGMYYKPRIDKSMLRKYAKGLIGLSGNLWGEVNEACKNNNMEEAETLAREYEDILGKNNFYLELIYHGENDKEVMDEEWLKVSEDQATTNKNLIALSKKTGIPIVASNDVHYLDQEHAEAHDVMTCLQRNYLVSDPNRPRYRGDQLYLKSAQEMSDLFADYPEAISNSMKIATRCNVNFDLSSSDNPKKAEDLHFPTFPLPSKYKKADEYLADLAKKGLNDLYGLRDIDTPKNQNENTIKERFYYELEILRETNYINYFLVVADFIHYARCKNIPVGPGRGSGAGSLLAYCLKITTVDPLRYSLLFERFMNPDRISPPDFDIDFCPTRRQEVIHYVREKYGEDCVAQIITFGTLGARSLMRDLGRVLDINLPYCDRLAKMIPDTPGTTLEDALRENPEFKNATENEQDAKKIMQYATLLEGLPRHTGMHAAGVVIGEKPLIEIIPLTREQKENLTVVQFGKDASEAIGLLKMDFLGLKNLTVIKNTCELIKRNHNILIDPEKLPLDDPKVYELLAKGDTVGIFQLESSGMRDTLRLVIPDCIQDVIAVIALYRPGPMQFIPTFAKRKHGNDEIKYDHELLIPILKETYGIIVYQEQIMQTAQTLAGFTLAQGDILRRAIGKKKAKELASQREEFIEGCIKKNQIDKKLAENIFDNIEKFAQYGFNKSHSAGYAIIAYQTAWLKAHYPGEFMAALLSSEMSNIDKLNHIISETAEIDLQILPPCVNESIGKFNVAGKNNIRFGMTAIKGVGEKLAEDIVIERDRGGGFTGFIDFCIRMKSPNRRMLESLIRCGAFDYTGIHRARLFNGIDMALSRATETVRDFDAGQQTFFDSEIKEAQHPDNDLPECDFWSDTDMLSDERHLTGFYVSGHPLTNHQWTIDQCGLHQVKDICLMQQEDPIRIGGMLADIKKLYTKKEMPMAVFRIETLEGKIQAVMFPDAYEKYGRLVKEEALMMIGGRALIEEGGETKIQILELHKLSQASSIFAERVDIKLHENNTTPKMLKEIKALTEKQKGDIPLYFCVECAGGKKIYLETENDYRISPSYDLIQKLEIIAGENRVVFTANKKVLKNSINKKVHWKKTTR